MEKEFIQICGIPAIIWGVTSSKAYLYVHGKGGDKEEAELFASIVCQRGWQVVSIDLPEHGERKLELNSFDPWHCTKELTSVLSYIKSRWTHIALYANSIGAYFCMLSFAQEKFANCLFVSPILDMQALIANIMRWANISEERLQKESLIPTQFGETLSWAYWTYVVKHPIVAWPSPTAILYASNDNLVSRYIIDKFVNKFNCRLTVIEQGEHWFHTPEQIKFLSQWISEQTSIKLLSKTKRSSN